MLSQPGRLVSHLCSMSEVQEEVWVVLLNSPCPGAGLGGCPRTKGSRLTKGGFSSSALQLLGHQVNKTDQGMLVTPSLKSQTDTSPCSTCKPCKQAGWSKFGFILILDHICFYIFLSLGLVGFILQEIFGQLGSRWYFHSALKPKFSPLSPSKSVVINYTVKTSTALPLLEPGSDSHYPELLPDTTSVPAAPTHSWLGIALPGEALQHPILPAKVIGARQGVPSTQEPGTAHATAKRK